MIKGKVIINTFDDDGECISSDILSPEKNYLYFLPKNTWNVMIPLDDYVVFNEVKKGPFDRETDAIWRA